ncbi:MAG: hypothetical protein AABY22_18425 [Nanoarchaeota archaeon]
MKFRYWSCYKCGRVERRYKKEEYKTCNCGYEMVKTRTIIKADKIRIRLNNKLDKESKFNDRQFGHLRNEGGEILKFSLHTKYTWSKLRKVKSIWAFKKYGQLLIDNIDKDIRNVKGEGWIRGFDGSQMKCSACNKPVLVIIKKTTYKGDDGKIYGHFGEYHTHLIKGVNEIKISQDRWKERRKDINDTMLHEIVHWIDRASHRHEHGHDKYFWQRLDLMKQKFRI